MALEKVTCRACSAEAIADLPDDGSGTIWECPICSVHNIVVGTNPVEEVAPTVVEGAVLIRDGDSGTGQARTG